MATIYTFNNKGGKLPVRIRPNLEAATDPQIQYARPTRNLSGRGVRVTNPNYSGGMARTASLGMGGVGQRGRYMDPA